jgi:hypothetical protein
MEISLWNEEMNDHLSLLLQGYAAKRKLAELFQSEGFVQENQPLTRHGCRLWVFECLKFLSFCLLHQLHFSAFLLLVINSFAQQNRFMLC